MNDDTRIDQYLSARATSVELPPAAISSVLDRVARRRRSRRAVFSACSAVAVLGGALAVVNLGGTDAPEHVVARPGGGTLVPSTLQWAVVTPRAGLGWTSSSVIGPGNALYALSTAPGSTADEGGPRTLYRSTDGVEWKVDTAPDGLNPVSLAANGDQLYAIGTGAAGGGVAVRLATRTGAGAWTTTDLPSDLAALEARYRVHLDTSGFVVAARGTTVIAAVDVQVGNLDALLPAGSAGGGYQLTDTGVDVFGAPEAAAPAAEGDAGGIARKRRPEVVASYTWAQLGIDATLRSLILGETRVFASDAGAPFTAVTPPAGLRSIQALVATTDGVHLLGTTSGTGRAFAVWSSADGRDWTAPPVEQSSGDWVSAVGTRQGRLAFVTDGQSSSGERVTVAHLQQAGGGIVDVDLVDAARTGGAEGSLFVATTAAGPQGVGAVVVQMDATSEHVERAYLVLTTGDEYSVTEVTAQLGTGYPTDLRITADAITLGWHEGDETTGQRLLVGTPPR